MPTCPVRRRRGSTRWARHWPARPPPWRGRGLPVLSRQACCSCGRTSGTTIVRRRRTAGIPTRGVSGNRAGAHRARCRCLLRRSWRQVRQKRRAPGPCPCLRATCRLSPHCRSPWVRLDGSGWPPATIRLPDQEDLLRQSDPHQEGRSCRTKLDSNRVKLRTPAVRMHNGGSH